MARRGKYSIGSSARHSGHSACSASLETEGRLAVVDHGASFSDAVSHVPAPTPAIRVKNYQFYCKMFLKGMPSSGVPKQNLFHT